MSTQDYTIEIITPCFLAGQNQAQAELRVPSIRGQLRWWFRVLGGKPEDERLVFGGTTPQATASAVTLRIIDLDVKHDECPSILPNTGLHYLFHFAKVSADRKRWQREGFLAPGTTFVLRVGWRRKVEERLRKQFDTALHAWLRLGSLGLRNTRGLGAIACLKDGQSPESRDEFLAWCQTMKTQYKDLLYIKTSGIEAQSFSSRGAHANTNYGRNRNHSEGLQPIRCLESYADWQECLDHLGTFLKLFRKANRLNGKDFTPLGYSRRNERHSSEFRLRPVKLADGNLMPVVFYTEVPLAQGAQARDKEKIRAFFLEHANGFTG